MERVNSHNNFYYFTASLIFLTIISAVVSSSPDGENHRLLQGVLFLTELVAYFTLNLSKRWRQFVISMAALTIIANIMREFTQWSVGPMTGLVVVLIFYCGMAYAAARQVLFTGETEPNTVMGAFVVYLLMGLIWAMLYLIALEYWPEGIKGINYRNWNDNMGVAVYYSFVTMTTLGYGDITPVMPVTRTLAYLQAICGTFYMAVVVASMVGALAQKSKKDP